MSDLINSQIRNYKLNNYSLGDVWYIGFAESVELITSEIQLENNFRYWEINADFVLEDEGTFNYSSYRLDDSTVVFVYSE
jgi:hypothetical protein